MPGSKRTSNDIVSPSNKGSQNHSRGFQDWIGATPGHKAQGVTPKSNVADKKKPNVTFASMSADYSEAVTIDHQAKNKSAIVSHASSMDVNDILAKDPKVCINHSFEEFKKVKTLPPNKSESNPFV